MHVPLAAPFAFNNFHTLPRPFHTSHEDDHDDVRRTPVLSLLLAAVGGILDHRYGQRWRESEGHASDADTY